MSKMKKTSILMLTLLAITALTLSCKQDEATISSNIKGSWKADSTKTVYNGGLLAQYVAGVNSDSIGEIVKPAFNGCSFTFNSDNSGAFAFPYMDLRFTDTYVVGKGKVTITTSKNKQISLDIASISSTQMTAVMSITDFTSIIDSTATTNVDALAQIEALLPTLNDVNTKIGQAYTKIKQLNLSAVGLNVTPTITLVLNKQ